MNAQSYNERNMIEQEMPVAKPKQISHKTAREKYGVIISKIQILDGVRFYLLDNGNIIDSIGDIRYISK
jgi:hypothetical protein